MRKKLISLLLVATMALSLTACGGSSEKAAGASETKATEAVASEEKAEGENSTEEGEQKLTVWRWDSFNVDAMKKVLGMIEDKEEEKRKAESSDLKCLRCSAPMAKIGRRKFQMGSETFFFDSHMFDGSMELDVLRCTQCGKVEFFSPKEDGNA